jgi:hypothetical protein
MVTWKSLLTDATVSGMPQSLWTGDDVRWGCGRLIGPLRTSCSSAAVISNAKSSSECSAITARAMANHRMALRCQSLLAAMSLSLLARRGTSLHGCFHLQQCSDWLNWFWKICHVQCPYSTFLPSAYIAMLKVPMFEVGPDIAIREQNDGQQTAPAHGWSQFNHCLGKD